ncbi:MAG: class I SAM-dependent methyltransferase, partial [Micromonosporaceae bacterium]
MTAAYPMPVPSSAKPVGGLGRLVAVARAARRETATLLRRHGLDRTPARSADEYEARWNRQQQAARWLSVADISQAPGLSSYGQAQLRALMEFGVFDISAPAFFTWRGRKIAHVVSQHAEPSSPVVELGCGLGKNLIALAASGFTNLGGLDVTPSAVCAVRRQFAHFGIECDARLGDLLDLGPSRDFLHGKTLFTNYVLEQLPRDLTTALTE